MQSIRDLLEQKITKRQQEINRYQTDSIEKFLQLPQSILVYHYEKVLIAKMLVDIDNNNNEPEEEIVAHYVKVWTREILDRRWSPRNSCQFTKIENHLAIRSQS